MINSDVYIIAMAGGVGNRLAPLSTPEIPKQFLNLYGSHSLLQHTCLRFTGGGYSPDKVFAITSREYFEQTVDNLETIGISSWNVLFEPERKGTLHCIAYALSLVPRKANDKDPIIAFVPADHFMKRPKEFIKTFNSASYLAEGSDSIVLIGAKPEYPESGFGYFHVDNSLDNYDVDAFAEKPENPQSYIDKGYVWNTGIFVAKKSTFINAIQSVDEDAYSLTQIEYHVAPMWVDNFYTSLWSKSFDEMVLEKFPKLKAIVGDFGWNDLGDYERYTKLLKEGSLNEVTN